MQITKFAISSSLHCTANNIILNIVGIRVCQRFSRESEATLSDIGSETHTGRLAGEAGHHSAQPRHDSVRLCEGGGGRGPAGVRAGGGIGDELEAPEDQDFYPRFAFDISFFFFNRLTSQKTLTKSSAPMK